MREDIQRRVAPLVQDVLGDLNLSLHQTHCQGTGDGVNVFLPLTVEVHRALPVLIRSWQQRLALDNRRFRDRLRLRMATVVGPIGLAAIGFTGSTIVEMYRLLDSPPLRQAIADHPDADLAVLVSDHLYAYVVGEGHPGLDAAQFHCHHVAVKGFSARAWLWVAT